jgi:hypothetical protein
MTQLHQYKTGKEELKELLIKNLPSKIKAGNEKHLSNVTEYKTIIALNKCKFINFNTSERISFMVFDIDSFKNKTALEYFKNIDGFLAYISEKIGLEPSYILETQKGFHFAYHLKNHIFTKQEKALKYLLDVKRTITELLKCDEIASHRLHGVWRNPLLHTHYYSEQINYELKDFRDLIPKVEYKNRSVRLNIKVDDNELVQGQRNHSLFKYAMRFAKGQDILTKDDIFEFLSAINLPNSELTQIASSVFKYWQNGTIKYGSIKANRDIDEGAMEFPKMRNLSKEEYDLETKHRQKQSALRTSLIRDKEKNKKQLLDAKRDFNAKRAEKNQVKVLDAIVELGNRNEKITFSSIAKLTSLDRKTVKKYFPSFT